MSTAKPNEQGEPGKQPRHAGVWVRIGANLIDLVILGVPVLLVVFIILGARPEGEQGTISLSSFYNLESLLNAAILAVITILLWVNWDGRTPGKKLLSIRITSYPGYKPFSYGTATVRSLLSLTGALTFGLGYLAMAVMVGAREDKRGYHDLMAGTCVVHDR